MNTVSLELDSRVARVCLRRPASKNSLDLSTVRLLLDSLRRAEQDPEAGAILLEAEGPLFSCGLEVSEALLDSTAAELESIKALLEFGHCSAKPLVCAVRGGALGAGAALVASSHVALAAQGSSFAFTEIRAGQWPYLGWAAMERALGGRRALELSLTGRVFSALDALTWGLIHEITQPSELEDRALATASLLASAPPETVRQALAWLREPSDPVEPALRNFQSGEAREGLDALLQKRRPEWGRL